MSDILKQLTEQRHSDIKAQAAELQAALDRGEWPTRPTTSFSDALTAPGMSVIAEIKRASPSRGHLAEIPNPAALAAGYVQGGARAISVLTTPVGFNGRAQDLREVSAAGLAPALCKDFVTHPLHLAFARLNGASAVLLIVAAFDGAAPLRSMHEQARALGLDVLVEVHDGDELDVALEAGARIVGVNHRNLKDFSMDMTLFERLRPRIPTGVLAVAESGIKTADMVQHMHNAGADAVLIGEAVSAQERPEQKISELLAWQGAPA
jgi:indole-3-glycerol phosphate synthase